MACKKCRKKLLENLNLIFRPPKNGPDDASPLAATGPGNLLPLWLCVVHCPRTVTVYNKGTYIYTYVYVHYEFSQLLLSRGSIQALWKEEPTAYV